ncbi:ABC transporter substrate-binding protein [Paenarthrobacter sp. YIM B13468]|uniref:ABC transporter substrate-binding protein n=1 Tax=Paenarthrobacter sp. YIM B13468 TaxID=3366295 RepID=UPI00366CFFB2
MMTSKKGLGGRALSAISLMTVVLALNACAGTPATTSTAGKSEVLVDKARCDRNRAAGPITYISGYGYSASAGQMDVFMAKELGYFEAMCLDVQINASGANGQQLVASGQAQFTALGSASDVMLAAANSRNLTAVATYGNTSPFSIFANQNIKSLKDLEGKKLGYFINLTPMASAMLDKAGVDVSKVELVKMTNYDPTVVTRGQVDAIVGYASNQPEKLKALGLPFTEFLPSDFGISGTYNVMETNSEFLAKNREVVADFMRADLKALEFCLSSSEECVDKITDLAAANNQGAAFPKDQQARTWAVESGWIKAKTEGAPGVQSVDEWAGEYELVQRYGKIGNLPPVSEMMDTKLVADLYRDKQLAWPGE